MYKLNLAIIKVKSRADWACIRCGSTEKVQGHHQIPKDDSTIISLCAECHSKEHPTMPKNLFLRNKINQPFWDNISASSVAKKLKVCSRTVIRASRKLHIPSGILSKENMHKLKYAIKKIPLKNRRGSKFMKVYQDTLDALIAKRLRGESYYIFLKLIAKANYNNILPSASSLAKLVSMQPSHVNRAYRDLEKAGFIVKRDHVYYLSPYVAWKGNAQQEKTALESLSESSPKLIEGKKV